MEAYGIQCIFYKIWGIHCICSKSVCCNLCYYNINFVSCPGELKVNAVLDREDTDTYYLTAVVHDRENPEWECVSYVEVILTDVNDNAPSFPANTYTVTISEDAPIGTLVTKMYATDMDRGR